jgi:hypothetical protein
MAEADSGTPLRARSGDWFFVVAFTCFALSSWLSDIVPALGIPIGPDSPNPLARANWFYARDADPLLIASPFYLQVSCFISAFVFGAFYPVLVYAFVTGANWIRVPAIVYVSAMTYGMVMFLCVEFLGPLPPTNLRWFLFWNLPYLLIPLALGWRMRHPHPFGARTTTAPGAARTAAA